jgi:hypothetical protein
MSSGGTRPGLQNPTPTSRARPVLYLRTTATFAVAAPRRAGRTSRLAQLLLPVPTLYAFKASTETGRAHGALFKT